MGGCSIYLGHGGACGRCCRRLQKTAAGKAWHSAYRFASLWVGQPVQPRKKNKYTHEETRLGVGLEALQIIGDGKAVRPRSSRRGKERQLA